MQLPSLRQLEYLVAVADLGHFGRAARRCGVSQPALSRQVREAEALFGEVLFERSRPRVLVTASGEVLVAQARRVLAEARALEQLATSLGSGLAGTLRMGVIPTIAPYLLPALLAEIHAEAPDLRLELREEQTDPLQALIARGELDVGVLALPVSGDGFEEHVLFYEPFVLAAPRGHPLDRPGPVTAQELEGHQLLLMTEGHCFRDHALAACAEAGATGRADLTATSLTTLIMMVQGGLGATLLPASALSSIPVGPQLALRSFSSPPTRAIGLRWRRTSPRGESYRALGTLMVEHLLRRPVSAEVQGPAPVFCVADA